GGTVGVVARVGVELVAPGRGYVGHRSRAGDGRGDGQGGRGAGRQCPHRPHTSGRVVGADGGRRRDENQTGWQWVGDGPPRGGIRPFVGQGEGEGDDVTDVRRRVIDRLGDGQVGLLRDDHWLIQGAARHRVVVRVAGVSGYPVPGPRRISH